MASPNSFYNNTLLRAWYTFSEVNKMKKILTTTLLISLLIFSSCGNKTISSESSISSSVSSVKEPAVKEENKVSVDLNTESSIEEIATIVDESEETDDSKLPSLSVSGSNIVNSNGEPVVLKGLSTHGIAWFPSYINEEFFHELKDKWNCSVVRIAMYTDEYGGFCSGGNKDDLLKLIDDGVNFATDSGLYVIVDWHILSDANPNIHIEEAKEFFKTVSLKYKDYTNVIYEICNEPNGNTTWNDIKDYANTIIPIIRENDDSSIIIVGTPNWSQVVTAAKNDPITDYDNIMYALHFYADTHRDSLRNTLEDAVSNGLPVFVTEYGICDASGNGAINEDEARKWMELLDKYNVSSITWNISNKEETSAIFKSSCTKKSGFTYDDLSESGKWVLNNLGGSLD